jgi:succinate dehydrogenase hydrophobic anchor subunit
MTKITIDQVQYVRYCTIANDLIFQVRHIELTIAAHTGVVHTFYLLLHLSCISVTMNGKCKKWTITTLFSEDIPSTQHFLLLLVLLCYAMMYGLSVLIERE